MCIQRYKNKRRNWAKLVSYDCRKKIAENRVRIGGRFIPKEVENNITEIMKAKSSNREEIYDDKNNLDLQKLQKTIKLFSTSKNIHKISKKVLFA